MPAKLKNFFKNNIQVMQNVSLTIFCMYYTYFKILESGYFNGIFLNFFSHYTNGFCHKTTLYDHNSAGKFYGSHTTNFNNMCAYHKRT